MIIIPVLHENIDKGTYISRYLQPEPSRNPRNLTNQIPIWSDQPGAVPKEAVNLRAPYRLTETKGRLEALIC